MFYQPVRKDVVYILDDFAFSEKFENWRDTVLKGHCELVSQTDEALVAFELEEDAILYSITWCEPLPPPYTRLHIKVMQHSKVMPTITAKDILNVSPLHAPMNLEKCSHDGG